MSARPRILHGDVEVVERRWRRQSATQVAARLDGRDGGGGETILLVLASGTGTQASLLRAPSVPDRTSARWQLLLGEPADDRRPLGGDRPPVEAPIPLAISEPELTESAAGPAQLGLVGAEPLSQVRVGAMDPGCDLEEESSGEGPSLEGHAGREGARRVQGVLEHSQQRVGGAADVAALRRALADRPKL